MRILVVEDDPLVAASVRAGLEGDGFDVDILTDGPEGLAAAMNIDYDAIVLDVMLPGLSGVEVSKRLRSGRRPTPILMLTALDQTHELVAGFNAGADDYVSKPFVMAELIARIKALVRRQMPARNPKLVAGSLIMDTLAHSVSVAGNPVALTAREYAILEYLMMNRGRVVTRTQVLEHVWGVELEGGDNLVEVLLGRIRRKLAAAGCDQPVTTIRGAGYRLD